jgi:hypothetical protein
MVLDIQTVHHILKNTAVQNVNKPFVYITDLTSTLNPAKLRVYVRYWSVCLGGKRKLRARLASLNRALKSDLKWTITDLRCFLI